MRVAVVGLRGVPDIIGGVEAHCERLYPALAIACPQIEFWLLSRKRFTAPGMTSLGLAKVRALWSPKLSGLEAAVHTVIAILYARLFLKADLVHIHGIGPAFFAPLSKFLGMRTVVTHHAPDYARPKWGPLSRRFLMTGETIAARTADRIICVSESVKTDFLQRHPEAEGRAVTITHGIYDVATPTAAEQGVLHDLGLERSGYIIAVGRLDETKRFHDLTAAAATAGKSARPIVIVGSSVDGNAYADELKRSPGPNVIFAGDRYGGELAALYQGAALLIHPSEMEGFGLVVLEALSLGTPAFVSDIAAHREFALPEEAYFRVGDIDAIRHALEAPTHLESVVEVTRAFRERYSARSAVDAHRRVFESLS